MSSLTIEQDLRPNAVILVEGESDRVAVETVAARLGRELSVDGVAVVATGGVTNFSHFLRLWGGEGSDLRIAGLYDLAEEHVVARALKEQGRETDRNALESMGFFVCVADLEDELIRATGADNLVSLIEREGESGSWRLFRGQPAQRSRDLESQLHRFMGTKSGRKVRLAGLMAGAMERSRIPTPLMCAIDYAIGVN